MNSSSLFIIGGVKEIDLSCYHAGKEVRATLSRLFPPFNSASTSGIHSLCSQICRNRGTGSCSPYCPTSFVFCFASPSPTACYALHNEPQSRSMAVGVSCSAHPCYFHSLSLMLLCPGLLQKSTLICALPLCHHTLRKMYVKYMTINSAAKKKFF